MSAATRTLAPPIARDGWLKLTPLDRRRLDNFKANKRGYWSFWLFMTLFAMSLLSNILANDRPIFAWY
ncbi:MAG: ABC transporter permease, partial [Methylocystis sp.]|nr:ABC transporter permease [Methylocystis sp.]